MSTLWAHTGAIRCIVLIVQSPIHLGCRSDSHSNHTMSGQGLQSQKLFGVCGPESKRLQKLGTISLPFVQVAEMNCKLRSAVHMLTQKYTVKLMNYFIMCVHYTNTQQLLYISTHLLCMECNQTQ